MATLKESYKNMEIKALKASRNLHKDFTRYLCGLITFYEFIQICRDREAKFEAECRKEIKDLPDIVTYKNTSISRT